MGLKEPTPPGSCFEQLPLSERKLDLIKDVLNASRHILNYLQSSAYTGLNYNPTQIEELSRVYTPISYQLTSPMITPDECDFKGGAPRPLLLQLPITEEGFRTEIEIREDCFHFDLTKYFIVKGIDDLPRSSLEEIISHPALYPFQDEPGLRLAFWYYEKPTSHFPDANALFRDLTGFGTDQAITKQLPDKFFQEPNVFIPVKAYWSKDLEELAAIYNPDSENNYHPFVLRRYHTADPQNVNQEPLVLVRKANIRTLIQPSPTMASEVKPTFSTS